MFSEYAVGDKCLWKIPSSKKWNEGIVAQIKSHSIVIENKSGYKILIQDKSCVNKAVQ